MNSMTALLGFTAWTLLLVIMVFSYRGLRLLKGAPINNWPRGKADTGDAAFAKRVSDAHANCLENLPIFAILVLAAAVMGKDSAVAPYAPFVLYARIGQSTALRRGSPSSWAQSFCSTGPWNGDDDTGIGVAAPGRPTTGLPAGGAGRPGAGLVTSRGPATGTLALAAWMVFSFTHHSGGCTLASGLKRTTTCDEPPLPPVGPS